MTDKTRSYPGFPGKIGRTREESEPHWQLPVRPAKGAPNVVIVFMDDLGWSDVGCYGSEIETPHIDALAKRGIRFNHYTTHPICSPIAILRAPRGCAVDFPISSASKSISAMRRRSIRN